MRADIYLFTHGYAKSRTHAAALITDGVTIDGELIPRPSFQIDDSPHGIEVLAPSRYVSRGGLKLEKALDTFGIDVSGITAADIGASTGGFTDCLLSHGACRVFAVDVGHGQLDASLRRDKRVVAIEGFNARALCPETLGEFCSVITSDVSFISQSLIYPAIASVLTDGGFFISLIKPQFEAGRAFIGKNGIVSDRKVHISVIERLFSEAPLYKLYPHKLTVSPITGGDGNREYLALFVKNRESSVTADDIRRCVNANS